MDLSEKLAHAAGLRPDASASEEQPPRNRRAADGAAGRQARA